MSEPTGQAAVDTLITRLSDADDLPTADHIDVYEDVHRGLRDALTALDDDRNGRNDTNDTNDTNDAVNDNRS